MPLRPTLTDLKKVVAAEVARAASQIEQSLKSLDLSYVLNSVGVADTSCLVAARTILLSRQWLLNELEIYFSTHKEWAGSVNTHVLVQEGS